MQARDRGRNDYPDPVGETNDRAALAGNRAGGLVGDFAGGDQVMESGNVVAGNPKVFKGVLQTIRPHLAGTSWGPAA